MSCPNLYNKLIVITWEPQVLNFLDQHLADDMQRIWKELKHNKGGETCYYDNCAYNNSNHKLIGIGALTGELERSQISHMERADDIGITKISNNHTPYITVAPANPITYGPDISRTQGTWKLGRAGTCKWPHSDHRPRLVTQSTKKINR